MNTTPQARLLIVDDEALHLKALCDTLEQEGYAPTGFTSANAALAALQEQQFDLLLTDLMMPEMDGISFLQAALELDKTLVGIVMTGQGTVPTAVAAMKSGALDYVLKPFKLSVVLPVITRALNVRRLRLENIQLRETVSIYELSMTIAFALDSEAVIRKMAAAAFEQGDASSVSVFLSAAEGQELYIAVALGQNADGVQGKRVPITGELARWIAETEKLILNSKDLAHVLSIPAPIWTAITNGVAIPMLAGGKLMGILNFSPEYPRRLVPLGRIKSLNLLAETAASALHAVSLLEELRAAELRYRLLADNAPDVIFRYELLPGQRCVYMSPSVMSVSGYAPESFYADPELGLKLVYPEDRSLWEEIFRGKLHGNTTMLRWMSASGGLIWIEQRTALVQDKDGKLIAIEGIARDITERVKLEEQLRQSQRMESVGVLAAGVAHDFNNMLTIINGYSELTMVDMPLDSPLRRNLEQITNASKRAAGLTRQLLTFSRKQVLQPQVLNINEIVESYSKMLGRLLGEDIELVTVLNPEAGPVKADQGQLEQVLMNLAVNSRDAMPKGGKLTIETQSVNLDDTYLREHIDVKPGAYVMLMVSDTGSGMDAGTRIRIFEPFFTTKELGKGTGLGLSIVYGIVKQTGGSIWVYSEPGKGTTFKIYLPRTDEQSEEPEAPSIPKRIANGEEAVLVVEDDEAVRRLTCTILQGANYKVFEAKDVQNALELLRLHKDQIGLVLTDLVMPELGGLALAEKMREIIPEIRVLYTSGYSDDVIVRHGHLDEGMPLFKNLSEQAHSSKRFEKSWIRRQLGHA